MLLGEEEDEPLSMEALEGPMFNLLLNIYNQESGYDFKSFLYEMLPLMIQLRRQEIIDSDNLIKLIAGTIYRVVDEIKNKLLVRAIEKHDLLAAKFKITTAPVGPETSPELIPESSPIPSPQGQVESSTPNQELSTDTVMETSDTGI